QVIGKGFTDEPDALAPVVELVENALWDLAGEGETDPYRFAQAVRRTVGRWVSEKWRRKPMIVPTVITSAVGENCTEEAGAPGAHSCRRGPRALGGRAGIVA